MAFFSQGPDGAASINAVSPVCQLETERDRNPVKPAFTLARSFHHFWISLITFITDLKPHIWSHIYLFITVCPTECVSGAYGSFYLTPFVASSMLLDWLITTMPIFVVTCGWIVVCLSRLVTSVLMFEFIFQGQLLLKCVISVPNYDLNTRWELR